MGHSTVASYRPTKASTSRVRTAPRSVPQPSWLLLIIVTATVAGVVWGLMQQRRPQVDPRQVIAINLAAGELAFEHARYFEPAEHSAVHYFNAVLALEPTQPRAVQRLEEIAHHFAEQAKNAILDAQFADAAVAIEHVRRVRADDRRLGYLEIELRKALDVHVAMLAAIEQPGTATSAAGSDSALAAEQSSSGALATIARVAPPGKVEQKEPIHSQPASIPTDAGADMSDVAPQQLDRATLVRVSETASTMPASFPNTEQDLHSYPQAEEAFTLSARAVEPQITEAPAAPSRIEPLKNSTDAAMSMRTQVSRAPAAPPIQISEMPESSSPIEVSARWLPTAIKLVEPDYPEAAQVRGIEGWVDLMLTVAPSGEVIDAQVRDREGSRSFERAALHAVRQWRYEPNAAGSSAPAQQIPARVAFKLE